MLLGADLDHLILVKIGSKFGVRILRPEACGIGKFVQPVPGALLVPMGTASHVFVFAAG